MRWTGKGMGTHKHGVSGTVHNHNHFHGKTAGKQVRRKGTSRRQRKQKRGTHKNDYEQFSVKPKRPPRKVDYIASKSPKPTTKGTAK